MQNNMKKLKYSVVFVFCLAFLVVTLLYQENISKMFYITETKKPVPKMFFYIAVDNSLSYGLPKNKNITKDIPSRLSVFDTSRNDLYSFLKDGVFKEGDQIIGISHFTDEPTNKIKNYIESPIAVTQEGWSGIATHVKDKINLIELRRGNYKTYYRNVLEAALYEFKSKSIPDEQSIFIMLTDERGSEVDNYESPPEKYPYYYVVKLISLSGEGNLKIVVNNKLSELSERDYKGIDGYVEDIRKKYVANHEKTTNKPLWKKIYLSIAVLSLIIVYSLFWAIFLRATRNFFLTKKEKMAIFSTLYNPTSNMLTVNAENFIFPSDIANYVIDDGRYSVAQSFPQHKGIVLQFHSHIEPGNHVVQIIQGKLTTTTKFNANAPAEQKKYQAHVAKSNDMLNPKTFQLSDSYINITHAIGLKTKLEARIDGYYFYLRPSGEKILNYDGTEFLGEEKYQLHKPIEIFLRLPDEYETIKINIKS